VCDGESGRGKIQLEKRLEISLAVQKFWCARERDTEREREKTAGEREKERRESGREGETREGLAMRTSGNASALYGHFWLY